ncbi:MAG: hypothetical protein WCL34_12620 [Methylococcaceae bacterium]|jgi:antitoxin component YwqK of YwqJK toxin-antitoxin module
MKIKTISALILLFSILVTGCSGKTTDNIEKRNGLAYAPNETEPFTGTLEMNHPSGHKKLKEHYEKGLANGRSVVWHDNGEKAFEADFENGILDGVETYWYEDGQKSRETHYKNGTVNGTMTQWDGEGHKVEKEYKNGVKISEEWG